MSNDGILAMQWKDKKTLQMLSAIHEGIEMTVAKEVTRRDQTSVVIQRKCVFDYINGMLVVDRPRYENDVIPNHEQSRHIKSCFSTWSIWLFLIASVSGVKSTMQICTAETTG